MPFDGQTFTPEVTPSASPQVETPEQRVLLAAADDVERPGRWCQGIYADGDTRCMLGALDRAAEELGIHWKLTHRCDAMIERIIGDRDIGSWNDAPGRTAAEVASALRAAARYPALPRDAS